MAPTPQGTAADEVGIRSLSARELADLWVTLNRSAMDTTPVIREFNRRYWLEQAERAEAGDIMRLHPPFKPLSTWAAEKIIAEDGPDPFAA